MAAEHRHPRCVTPSAGTPTDAAIIVELRREVGDLKLQREADIAEAAATHNALSAKIAELEAESLKWYKSAADGIDGALEHGVRETAARDLRITELEKLVDELRCGDLDAFHDGELPEARRAAFAGHLVTCERCQAGLQDLLYVDMVASTSGMEPPR